MFEGVTNSIMQFFQFSLKYVPDFAAGAFVTLQLTVVTFILGVLLGTGVAFMRMSKLAWVRGIATGYVEFIRGTPLLAQLFFIYFGLPSVGLVFQAFPAAVVAITLNEGAYISELVRGAVQSVDKGQMEAARSLGMGYWVAMWRIIMPQAAQRLMPPLVNELVSLTKNTSLVSVISLKELTWVYRATSSHTVRIWSSMLWLAFFYLLLALPLTRWASRLEARLEARQ